MTAVVNPEIIIEMCHFLAALYMINSLRPSDAYMRR